MIPSPNSSLVFPILSTTQTVLGRKNGGNYVNILKSNCSRRQSSDLHLPLASIHLTWLHVIKCARCSVLFHPLLHIRSVKGFVDRVLSVNELDSPCVGNKTHLRQSGGPRTCRPQGKCRGCATIPNRGRIKRVTKESGKIYWRASVPPGSLLELLLRW